MIFDFFFVLLEFIRKSQFYSGPLVGLQATVVSCNDGALDRSEQQQPSVEVESNCISQGLGTSHRKKPSCYYLESVG